MPHVNQPVTGSRIPDRTAKDLFAAIADGILDANINYEYPLSDAVKAHEALESGKTTGATVLAP